MQQSDWLGLILCIFGAGLGAVLSVLAKSKTRLIGVGLVAISVLGFAVWAGHFWRAAPPADAQSPPSVTGTCNAVGNNNSNCSPYINQAPQPALIQTKEYEWKASSVGVEKDYAVNIKSSGDVHKLTITAYGDSVTNVGFFSEGMGITGNGGNGEGWAWKEFLTPSSLRGFAIYAKRPCAVRYEVKFE